MNILCILQIVPCLLLFSSLIGQKTLSPQAYRDTILNTDSDSLKGWAYLQLAKVYTPRDLEKAKLWADSAEMYKAYYENSEGAQASILFTRAGFLVSERKSEEALAMYKEALATYKKVQNEFMAHTTLYKIGAIHVGKGNNVEATKVMNEGLAVARKIDDQAGIAGYLNALGVIQRRSGDLTRAKPYYEEALTIYNELDHLHGRSICLLNLAIIENRLKNFENAIAYYKEALDLASQAEPIRPDVIASIEGNLSAVYNEMGDFHKAIEYGEKSLKGRKEGPALNEEIFNSHLGLGINYTKIDNFDRASWHFSEAEKFTDENHNSLFQLKKSQAQLFLKNEDFKSAYKSLDESYNHKDSVYNKTKAEQIDELNIQYETERKENEIERLAIEDELNQSRIRQHRYGLLGAFSALGLLGFFPYRLRQKNQRIKKQDAEKEVLLKEIHHRVKNNLQVISSLLGLQGLAIKDEKAKAAIQEGRSRVHSMSLIHQSLYKKDNLTGIEMKPYLQKLTADLIATYNYQDVEIQSVINSEDITLDVETVVPIGLIINELVTNSVKYAFEGRQKGVIKVELSEDNGLLRLVVSDNGIGLDNDQLKTKEDSYGHSLIRAFGDKLDAEIKVENQDGIKIDLIIKSYKVVA